MIQVPAAPSLPGRFQKLGNSSAMPQGGGTCLRGLPPPGWMHAQPRPDAGSGCLPRIPDHRPRSQSRGRDRSWTGRDRGTVAVFVCGAPEAGCLPRSRGKHPADSERRSLSRPRRRGRSRTLTRARPPQGADSEGRRRRGAGRPSHVPVTYVAVTFRSRSRRARNPPHHAPVASPLPLAAGERRPEIRRPPSRAAAGPCRHRSGTRSRGPWGLTACASAGPRPCGRQLAQAYD